MNNEKTISVLFTFTNGQNSQKVEAQLNFPTTKENFRQMLERAGADGMAECKMTPMFHENEYFGEVGHLDFLMLDEANVNELNYLSARLLELDSDDLEKFDAIVESKRHIGDADSELADYINIIDNLDSFTFLPNLDEAGYGDQLLTGFDNNIDSIISLLRNNGTIGDEYADYVECLRECVDTEQFGKSMAANNDGEFLDSGYLIEDGGFGVLYLGLDDIPDKYRIWEQPDPFIKAVDVELSMLMLEMHALGGNYTQDAANNFQTFTNGGGDFFITESRGKLTVLPAEEVFHKNSPDNTHLLLVCQPDTRAFFVTVEEINSDGYWGNIREVNVNLIKSEADRLSYRAVNIDVEFKNGTNQIFTPAEWNGLSDMEREQASGMVCRYDPSDERKAAEFLGSLRGGGRRVTPEEFLAALNEPFMAKAHNAQPDMLRVARETARDMVARNDAEVFRLLPEGALKLSPIDVVKSNGLWFKEHREFAIKPGGLGGLRKWANRTADDIARQATRGEHKKSHDNEH